MPDHSLLRRGDLRGLRLHRQLTWTSRGQGPPLVDRYEVDLVLSGHEHNYERSYPVRGNDRGAHGKVVAPHPGQTAGERIDARRLTDRRG